MQGRVLLQILGCANCLSGNFQGGHFSDLLRRHAGITTLASTHVRTCEAKLPGLGGIQQVLRVLGIRVLGFRVMGSRFMVLGFRSVGFRVFGFKV